MRALRPVRTVSACGALALILALGSCGTRPEDLSVVVDLPQEPMPGQPFNPNYPVECPNIESGESDAAPAVHRDSTPPVSLAGRIVHIAEFHDCQRLTINGGTAFGPLVGVWARDQLGSLTPESYRSATGLPVAELYNYTTSPYRPLGIQPGYNCLYLRAAGNAWEARMLEQKGTDACPDVPDPTAYAGARRLHVSRHVHGNDVGHIPAAARWDYDTTNRMHFIGVRCGDEWCEVAGTAQHKSSTWYSSNRPTDHVKGWYDEQWLAVKDPGGRLVPGPRARLTPVPDLESKTERDFDCGSCADNTGWVDVASAQFTGGGHPSYVKKLNLRPGRTSFISMRYVSTGTARWESRIVSGSDTAYKKVRRVNHAGIFVPGTARWQWNEDDEQAWVRCSAGCCSVMEADS